MWDFLLFSGIKRRVVYGIFWLLFFAVEKK